METQLQVQEQVREGDRTPGPEPAAPQVPPGRRGTVRGLAAVAGIVAACIGLSTLFVAVAGKNSEPPRAPVPVSAAQAPAGGPVDVTLSEFKVNPAATTMAPGPVTLKIANAGTIQHELLVFRSDLAPSAYPRADGGINEEGPGILKVSDGDNIDPGAVQTRTVDLTQPGTYLFVCNLPGHYAAGMYQVVTVK